MTNNKFNKKSLKKIHNQTIERKTTVKIKDLQTRSKHTDPYTTLDTIPITQDL